MPTPFSVRPGDSQGTDLGEWDDTGSIRIPGDLTVGGVIKGTVDVDSVPGDFEVGGNLHVDGDLVVKVTGDATIGGDLDAATVTSTGDVSVGGDADVAGQVNINNSGSTAKLAVKTAATGDEVVTVRQGSQTNARITVYGDGGIGWGPGTTTYDTKLFRNGVGLLQTNNSLYVAGNCTTAGVAYSRSQPVLAVVDFGNRTTNGTATSTTTPSSAQGYMRLDNIPAPSGDLMMIFVPNIYGSGNLVAQLTFSDSGTAGAGSTFLSKVNGSGGTSLAGAYLQTTGSTKTLSVLLSMYSTSGSVNILGATAATTMLVYNCGPQTNNSINL